MTWYLEIPRLAFHVCVWISKALYNTKCHTGKCSLPRLWLNKSVQHSKTLGIVPSGCAASLKGIISVIFASFMCHLSESVCSWLSCTIWQSKEDEEALTQVCSFVIKQLSPIWVHYTTPSILYYLSAYKIFSFVKDVHSDFISLQEANTLFCAQWCTKRTFQSVSLLIYSLNEPFMNSKRAFTSSWTIILQSACLP